MKKLLLLLTLLLTTSVMSKAATETTIEITPTDIVFPASATTGYNEASFSVSDISGILYANKVTEKIQLNKTGGFVTTSTIGVITKIEFSYIHSSDRTISLYGSDEVYSGTNAASISSTNIGSAIGTLQSGTGTTSAPNVISKEFDETNQYKYIGFTVSGAAYFSSIKITYAVADNNKTTPTLSFGDVTEYTVTNKNTEFVEPTLTCDSDGAVTYASSDENVATVDTATGAVTIVGAGTTTITATSAETDTYNKGTATYTITVSYADPQLSHDGEASYTFDLENIDSFTAPTFSHAEGLTGVSYSSSNPVVATISEDGKTVEILAAGTTIISAESPEQNIDDVTYAAGFASYSITVKQSFVGREFTLVTSADELADPKYFYILASGTAVASNTSNASYLVSADYSDNFSDNKFTYNNENVLVFSITGNSTDGWAIATNNYGDTNGFISWNSGNSCGVSSYDASTCLMNISFTDGVLAINSKKESNRSLQYNSSSSRFAFYTSTQAAVQLYKCDPSQVVKKDPELSFTTPSVEVDINGTYTGQTVNNPNNLTITYSSSNEDVATVDEATGSVTILASGSTTITASFAGNDEYLLGSAEYTISVTDPNKTTSIIDFAAMYTANTKLTILEDFPATLTFDKNGGTDPQYFQTSPSALRFYTNNKLTISVDPKYYLTSVVFEYTQGSFKETSASVGTLEAGVWTINDYASSVTFTNDTGAQVRISKITVNYSVAKVVSSVVEVEGKEVNKLDLKLNYTPSTAGATSYALMMDDKEIATAEAPAEGDLTFAVEYLPYAENPTFAVVPTVGGAAQAAEDVKAVALGLPTLSTTAVTIEESAITFIQDAESTTAYAMFKISVDAGELLSEVVFDIVTPDLVLDNKYLFKLDGEVTVTDGAADLSGFTYTPDWTVKPVFDFATSADDIMSVDGAGVTPQAVTGSSSHTSGVEGITVDSAPVEYYNLQGVRVANPEAGIFIRRQGNSVTKVRM